MQLYIASFVVLAGGLTGVANAQVDPGSLERTIPRAVVVQPDRTSSIVAPDAPTPVATRLSGAFVLGAVQIIGSSKFDSTELSRSYEPYLAGMVDQQALNQIAANITELYRENGYFLSFASIPEQPVQAGVVKVHVFEGYIAEIEILGGSASARKSVSSLAGQLTTDRPVQLATLENVLGNIRDLPGVSVTDTKLSRSDTDPARHKLTISIAASRAGFFTFADNRGTVPGARMRGYSSASFNGVAVPGDQLQVEAFLIPSSRFQFLYGKLRHSMPLSSDGLKLALSAAAGRHYHELEDEQRGKFRQFSVGLSHPLARRRAFSATSHVQIEDWFGQESSAGDITQRDRYRVARMATEFSTGTSSRTTIRLGLSRGLGGSSNVGLPPSRPFGETEFTKFNVEFASVAPVSGNVSLRADVAAQYTRDSLLAPEEFALGGSRIGRAFDFNSVTGDSGIGGLLEMSYRLPSQDDRIQNLEMFAYVDGGTAVRNRPTPAFRRSGWLMSAGLGTRLTIAGLHLSGEVGHSITSSTDEDDLRAFFSIMKVY